MKMSKRSSETDNYMEEKFGEPDYSKTSIDQNIAYSILLTPFNEVKLWRVDPIFLNRRERRRR